MPLLQQTPLPDPQRTDTWAAAGSEYAAANRPAGTACARAAGTGAGPVAAAPEQHERDVVSVCLNGLTDSGFWV